MITAKEIRAILATVPDDQPIYLAQPNGDQFTVKSYSLHRYDDGKIELCFFVDGMCSFEL